MSKYSLSANDANRLNSIVYLISAFGSPILGLAIDKTGKNVIWIMVAIAGTISAHAILAFTYLNPYIAMVRL